MEERMDRLLKMLTDTFGIICLLMTGAVCLETFLRKLFAYSFQGVDELSGYALAVMSGLAFTAALISRRHTRIDVVFYRFPRSMQVLLNWFTTITFVLVSGTMAITGLDAFLDSVSYHSTAPTPLATPLMYPQFIWMITMILFFAVSCYLAMVATRLLLRRDWVTLDNRFQPLGGKEELEEELEDARRRE